MGGPLIILQVSLDVLEARQGFAFCPLCGTPTLLQRFKAQATASFGHNWALLLNPGDSPDFPTFLTDVQNFEQMKIPFVIDIFTSDIERFTQSWGYAFNNSPSGNIFQPPFTPNNTGYAIMLSPDELQQVAQSAPNTFIGMRTHEVPLMSNSPQLQAVLNWVVGQGRPLFINPGSQAWFPSWLPFIGAHGNLAVPLVNNNFINSLDSNWSTEVQLYRAGTVRKIGWSLQTFFILALTQRVIAPEEAPVDPYLLFFIYGRAYGASVFEVEPDSSVFTLDGTLTQTGRAVARFFQAVANRSPIPPGFTSRDTYGVIALNQTDQTWQANGEWMGDSSLTWSATAGSERGTLVVSYQVSQMSAPQGTALIAIWNPGPTAFPISVTAGGNPFPIMPSFREFGDGRQGAWYDGGNVVYVRTRGNVQIEVTYQIAQQRFTPRLSRLPINQLGRLPEARGFATSQ